MSHIRTVTFVVVTILISSVAIPVLMGQAYARANIADYLNTPPNGFEPQGWNTTGTAANFIVKVGGWDVTKGSGNFGIGDGSLATLNAMSNKDVNMTDHYIIGADISGEPWDPRRISSLTTEMISPTNGNNTTNETARLGNETQKNETGKLANETLKNETGKLANETLKNETGKLVNETQKNETVGETVSNETEETAASDEDKYYHGGYSDLFKLTHPISIGRPVNDLIYEDPFGIAISTYGRLMGLMMPDGSSINMGIRCLGYGY